MEENALFLKRWMLKYRDVCKLLSTGSSTCFYVYMCAYMCTHVRVQRESQDVRGRRLRFTECRESVHTGITVTLF